MLTANQVFGKIVGKLDQGSLCKLWRKACSTSNKLNIYALRSIVIYSSRCTELRVDID